MFAVLYKFLRSTLDCIFPSNNSTAQQDFDAGPMEAQSGNEEIGYKQDVYPSQPPAYNYG